MALAGDDEVVDARCCCGELHALFNGKHGEGSGECASCLWVCGDDGGGENVAGGRGGSGIEDVRKLWRAAGELEAGVETAAVRTAGGDGAVADDDVLNGRIVFCRGARVGDGDNLGRWHRA